MGLPANHCLFPLGTNNIQAVNGTILFDTLVHTEHDAAEQQAACSQHDWRATLGHNKL